jgi:hypothetical protein
MVLNYNNYYKVSGGGEVDGKNKELLKKYVDNSNEKSNIRYKKGRKRRKKLEYPSIVNIFQYSDVNKEVIDICKREHSIHLDYKNRGIRFK